MIVYSSKNHIQWIKNVLRHTLLIILFEYKNIFRNFELQISVTDAGVSELYIHMNQRNGKMIYL